MITVRNHNNALYHLCVIGALGWVLIGISNVLAQLPSETIQWKSSNHAGMQAYQRGRYREAKTFFLQALGSLAASPEQDPQRAMTLNNMGAVHERLGEYEEAEVQYRRALTIVERIQGPEHPDLVLALNNLASLYEHQEHMHKAEPLRRRALMILENVLGTGHPHLVPSLLTLARIMQAMEQVVEAEQSYIRALRITEHALGSDHPQLATILDHYAQLLRQTNREEEAHMLEIQATTIRSQQREAPPKIP
ncbi:MAG: tetratricopeptide repeat protein [Nitrospirales bacterium]|nr:tetratricopeptide repeat protein [Nitrospirales bacterium]